MLQRQFRVHVLEPSIFFFQLTQAANVGGFHAAVLCLPLVVGGVADFVFATNVSDGLARLDGFQDGDDLRLAEFALSHSASWRHTRSETSTFQWPGFWGGLHYPRISWIWFRMPYSSPFGADVRFWRSCDDIKFPKTFSLHGITQKLSEI